MVLGGCHIKIGINILINFIFVKYFQKLGNNMQLKDNGLEKQWEVYVLKRCLQKVYQNIFKSILMKNGSIIHNIKLKYIKKLKYIFHLCKKMKKLFPKLMLLVI